MADPLIHLDSCDHYDSSTSVIKWASGTTVNNWGRTGGQSVRNGSKYFNLMSTITTGVAVFHSSLGDNIFTLSNSGTGMSFKITLQADSRIKVTFQPFTSVGLLTSTSEEVTVCRASWWFYLEVSVTHSCWMDASNKSHHKVEFTVKINEQTILEDSLEAEYGWPYDFVIETGFTIIQYLWDGHTNGYDDIYITTAEFLGDIKIYCLYPVADGDIVEWTALNAGDNYEEVDEHPPDYDTSYIYADTVGLISMVEMDDITLQGEIRGVQINTVGEKDTAGSNSFVQYNKISGSYVEGSDPIYPSYLNWLDQVCCFRKNPITSNDFTNSEINAMQVGVKRTE